MQFRYPIIATKFVLIVTSLFWQPAHAYQLSEPAKTLQKAYQSLEQQRGHYHKQKQYLKVFPKNARLFNQVFNKDGLEGSFYIFALEDLSIKHPQETFELLIPLASELKWASGAPDYLQFVLMKIALNDPFSFATAVNALSSQRQKSLVKFLTAGKKGPAIGYRQLIEVLDRINKSQIADLLKSGLKSQ